MRHLALTLIAASASAQPPVFAENFECGDINPRDVLIFTGERAGQLAKFQEMGTYRAVLQPSYQENQSPAGQGRGEATSHGEGCAREGERRVWATPTPVVDV